MYITEIVPNCRCKITIAIEGPDAVGKQTQAQLLVDHLNQLNKYVTTTVEVPYDDSINGICSTYKQIYKMLHDGTAEKFPATLQGLFITNRFIFQQTVLKEMLLQNDILIFDRWNGSTYAYGRATGLSNEELECSINIIAKPDITIILSGDAYFKDNKDTFENNLAFQKSVSEYYLEWAQINCASHIVHANDTRDNVHNNIWNIINSHLNLTEIGKQ